MCKYKIKWNEMVICEFEFISSVAFYSVENIFVNFR